MIIGRIPKRGELPELNKWYIGLELKARPDYMTSSCFRPFLLVCCMIIFDHGEEHVRFDGRPRVKIGGWRFFTSKYGVYFEIIK